MTQTPSPNQDTTVAVVGLGYLGRGIATCLLGHGFRVIGCARSQASHELAVKFIDEGLREMVAWAGANSMILTDWKERYLATDRYDNWSRCDFVIESVDEDANTKNDVFDKIESVVGPEVPIASNTSAIPITSLQQNRRHPERFVGMHWFEPAHATRFLELIPGEHTSTATMEAAVSLARRCGKDPSVLKKDVAGFVVNRLGYALYREALNILEQGVADAETIDRSFRNAIGVWSTICGPLQWIDLTGGPALYAEGMKRVLPTLSNTPELPESIRRLAEEDALGVTNGRGFYHYTREEAELAEALFREHAWKAGAMLNEYSPLKDG